MVKEYPEEKQRSAVAYSTWRSSSMENAGSYLAECGHCQANTEHDLKTHRCTICGAKNDAVANRMPRKMRTAMISNAGVASDRSDDTDDGWPQSFPFRFIEPGLVNYDDSGKGTVLVKKEVLDRMAQTLVDKPVINNEHRDVSPDDYKNGKNDGIVKSVSYNAATGWFEGVMSVWDQETKKNCRNGFATSCAYNVKDWGPGGIHNNISYDAEVLDGKYEHLAIVPNPRYEGATISLMQNSKGGSKMKINLWPFKKGETKPLENAVEIDTEKASVEVAPGKNVPLGDMIKVFNSVEKKREEEEALKNAKPVALTEDDLVDVGGGKKVTVRELRNSFLKNADDDEADKKAKEKAENAAEEEKQKKEKDDAENAMKDEHEKDEDGDHKKNAVANCAMCSNAKAAALKNAGVNRPGNIIDTIENSFPEFDDNSIEAKIKRGLERYGAPVETK